MGTYSIHPSFRDKCKLYPPTKVRLLNAKFTAQPCPFINDGIGVDVPVGIQLRDCQNHSRHAQQHHLRHFFDLRCLLHRHGHLYSLLVSP